MPVVTTLSLGGRTEEALALYREVLGAETLFLLRFRDCPDPALKQPGMEEKIFHATFRIDGTTFMASDVGGEEDGSPSLTGFSLALSFAAVDRAKEVFDAFARDGRVVIPLSESSFTSWYGIVVDRIGVSWKINVDESKQDE